MKHIDKDISISNSKKRFRQYQKQLDWSNIKGPVLLHPPIPLLLKVLKKFQEEGKIVTLIAPSWKGQVWTDLLKKLTISTIPLGKSENFLIKGKAIVKRDLQLPPENLNAYLLRNSSFTMKTKESRIEYV
jgi:hypothetical protein